jgi:hypothetical protein
MRVDQQGDALGPPERLTRSHPFRYPPAVPSIGLGVRVTLTLRVGRVVILALLAAPLAAGAQ